MTAGSNSLLAIEEELGRQTSELPSPMLEVCRYAMTGGRRTRALLLLGAAPQSGQRAVLAATAVEMIHAATLLQDDIFDAGDLRRGHPAAHLCFGKPLAILASDWLLIRALELAADVDPSFFRCLARAGTAMTQAEAREFKSPRICSLAEAQIYGGLIARGKTAALFGTALCGAAVLQEVSADERSRWEQIGVEMGLTYQFVDDCVDLYGAQVAAGKTLRHDLLAGCFTMPVLLAARCLEEHGAPVSLGDLQAGCLAVPELLRLEVELRSTTVMLQVREILQHRFATNRKEATEASISHLALDVWENDLLTRLDPCFRVALSPANAEPLLAQGATCSSIAWQRHA